MRTVSFKRVLWGVASRLGLDPKVNLQDNQAASITEYINSHVRRAWEYFDWPEMVVVEQRQFRDAYDAGVNYAVGAEVWDATTALYYVALQAGTGHAVSEADYWAVQTALNKYVALDQPGKTAIGEALEVYDRDPYANLYALKVPYTLSYNGVQLLPDAPNTVWVRFRLRPAVFTSESWGSGTTYAVGAVVYLAATGECYAAIQGGTGKDPATEAEYWSRVEFPYVLAEYAKGAAYAEALREDGQADKAAIEDSRAQGRLEDEIEKVVGQQGASGSFSVALP